MDESKKVYIVTSGEYSSYGIITVFSNEADAEAYVERHNRAAGRWDRASVEEWDLDATIPRADGKIAYDVAYHYHTSWGVQHSWEWRANADLAIGELPFEDVQYIEDGTPVYYWRWQTWVWADDEQAALKIGADKIMPVLAEHQIEGVEPPRPDPLELDTPFLTALGGPPVMGDYTRKVEWGVKDGE